MREPGQFSESDVSGLENCVGSRMRALQKKKVTPVKSLELYLSRTDIELIVGAHPWTAPATVRDVRTKLETLNQKVLFWERRSVVLHPVKIWQKPEIVDCGVMLELVGGGQLNVLKVSLEKGMKEIVEGEGTPFARTLSVKHSEDLFCVWIGVPPNTTEQHRPPEDWRLQKHSSLADAWKDVSMRFRAYRPLLVK